MIMRTWREGERAYYPSSCRLMLRVRDVYGKHSKSRRGDSGAIPRFEFVYHNSCIVSRESDLLDPDQSYTLIIIAGC